MSFHLTIHNRIFLGALMVLGCLLSAPVPAAQASNAVIGTFGASEGEAGGQLIEPKGIAVNDTGAGGVSAGDVYVADSKNNRIEEFSASGAFVRVFGYDVVESGQDNTGHNEQQTVDVSATGGSFTLSIAKQAFATFTAGSNVVREIRSPASSFHVGDVVSGGGVPPGTTIIAVGAESLILSEQAASTFAGEFHAAETTVELPYDVTATKLETALESLPAVGPGSVAVSGGPGATGTLALEFIGALGKNDIPQLTANSSSLTGATQTVTIKTAVQGGGDEVCEVVSSPNDICKAGSASSMAGGMSESVGVAVDQSNGNIYATDLINGRINVYSAKGAFEGAFGWNVNAANPKQELQFCTTVTGCQRGSEGGGAGQLGDPNTDLPTVGPNGRFYLPDAGNMRIDEFAPVLNGLTEVTGVSFVKAFGWDVVASGPDNVTPVDAVQKLTIPPGSEGSFTLTFDGQTTTALSSEIGRNGLATALDGLSSVGGRLGAVQAVEKGAGVWELIFGGYLEDVPVPEISVDNSGLTNGEATISVLADGVSPYEQCDVAVHPSDVCKRGLEGIHLGQFDERSPTSVAVDSSGAVYAVDQFTGHSCGPGSPCRVLKFSPDASESIEFAPPYLTNTNGEPEAQGRTDVAVDPANDHVLVAKEEGTESIKFLEFDSAGTLLAESPGEGGTLKTAGHSSNRHGLAIGSDGRFYFSNSLGMVDIFGPPPAPAASISAVTDVGATSATFHGVVTPPAAGPEGERFDTTYHFEYSLDGEHWSRFPAEDVDAGNGSGAGDPNSCPADDPPSCNVSQSATGLEPKSHYQVRLVASTGTAATSASESFETQAAAPAVGSAPAEEISQESATLAGSVNPDGEGTTYRFQWGPTTSYGSETPVTSAGAGGEEIAVKAAITGLQPGLVYHYRIVAGNATGTTEGPDREFTTLDGFSLPDGRAPEQVSAADKRPVGSIAALISGQITTQVSSDGDSVLYPVLNGLAGATTGGNVSYEATRGASGWSSTQLSPPSLVAASESGVPGSDQSGHVLYYSPNLSCGLISSRQPLTEDTPPSDVETGVENLYRRNPDGSYTLLTTAPPANNPNAVSGALYQVDGASADCSHVLFESRYQLLSETPSGAETLYEWADGAVTVAGVLPDESLVSGAVAGGPGSRNPMSADGSRAFFTVAGKVFVRVGGAETLEASQSQTATSDSGASYQMASGDGSHVFFTARYGLATNGSSIGATSCSPELGEGCDLYSYDVDTRVLEDLSADAKPADKLGAGVAGLIDVSQDGSYAYFAARGQLAPGKGKTEAQNLATSSYSVYLSHEGQLSYVGEIAQGDMANQSVGSDSVAFPGVWAADATPDGVHLLFLSHSNVTGYVSGGVLEAYLYSASSGETVCVSCRADGKAAIQGNGGFDVVEPIATEQQFESLNDVMRVRPRSLSDDGRRVFFKMHDALVPGAIAGRRNFYEWENGQVYLLVPGEGNGESDLSEYLGASASGDDVIVRTTSKLVAQDFDNTADVYDFRAPHVIGEKVGFPSLPPAPAPCDPLADECQGDAMLQPAPGSRTASGVFSGPGNPPSATPCKTGYVVTGGKCVKQKPGPKQKKTPPKCKKRHVRKHGKCVKLKRKKSSSHHEQVAAKKRRAGR